MTQALAIKGLEKTYKNGAVALKGIDLEVEQGDFFALLGPNGAGKSTTIGIVCSLINKDRGEVSVLGHDLDRERKPAKASIGLVPQEFNFNVWEPVEEILINQAGYYGIERNLARERTEHYLKRMGLWEKRRTIGRAISSGMKRRLMLARALVHKPQLLILDEPTAGVDIETRRSVWAFMREINANGTTIILTTHYLEEAESLCRNIAIINRGSIIEHSGMQALLRKLHRETVVLNLDTNLEKPPRLNGFEVRLVDSSTLEVDIEMGTGLNGLFNQLSELDVQVLSMRNKTNRLEELFLNLVEGDER